MAKWPALGDPMRPGQLTPELAIRRMSQISRADVARIVAEKPGTMRKGKK